MSSVLDGPAPSVAPRLLGCILRGPNGAGRIVEVEAYGGADDPASHAFGGPSERNRHMFGPAGTLYVYLIYGMHHCANIATGGVDEGQAVLIRALEPVGDTSVMRRARPVTRAVELTNGPGKLCEALGIDRSLSGLDTNRPDSTVFLERRDPLPDAMITRSPRVGISKATDRPWRFTEAGSPWVSRPPPVATDTVEA